MTDKVIRLFGGHRNKVFRIDGKVKIVWKDGFKRRKQIREGVSLENFVAAHTDIKSRMLVDKSKPVEEENGKLLTYFHYCEGEIRYPWNLAEIASAAKLLTKFHQSINASIIHHPSSIIHQLHLDFARGNVLFRFGSSDAIGVIDFETTAVGPVEQELGRSMSFILVDTPIARNKKQETGNNDFDQRMNCWLTNYPLPYRKDRVVEWTLKYLADENYGSLNNIRDKALSFLSSSRASNVVSSDRRRDDTNNNEKSLQRKNRK